MQLSPRHKGTRLSAGHPEADRMNGFASDDPPEPATYRCDRCDQFFTENDSTTINGIRYHAEGDGHEGDLCSRCVMEIDNPPDDTDPIGLILTCVAMLVIAAAAAAALALWRFW